MASLPTQRSIKHLKALGYTVTIVEHWNAHVRRRQDLFGFGDLLAIRPGEILIVQTTDDGDVSKRLLKIMTPTFTVKKKTGEKTEHRYPLEWLIAGGKIAVHGWGKKGARGERKVWKLREIPVTVRDFEVLDQKDVAADAPQR